MVIDEFMYIQELINEEVSKEIKKMMLKLKDWEIDYLCMKLRQLYNEIHLTYLSSRTSLEVDKTDNKIIDKIIENNVKKLEPPLTPNNKPKENTLIILEGNKPGVLLLIPFVGFINYESKYNFGYEILYKPTSNFINDLDDMEIYKHWIGKFISDFKWNKFGRFYHTRIWLIYTIFLLSFAVVTTSPDTFSDRVRNNSLTVCIALGSFFLSIEFRQFIWRKKKYIKDYWNYFDVGAYLLPIIASIYWLRNGTPPERWMISLTNLLLDLRFMLFFRAFEYFGVYYAIILGVAEKVFSFLLILFLIVLSFSHALFVLLKPAEEYSLDQPIFNNDQNNPWNLVDQYYILFSDNTLDSTSYFVKKPDDKVNMFTRFHTSILAMYNFLTGDNSVIGAWSLQEDPYLAILVIIFSFVVVVYMMNLFIGLLSNAIEEHDTHDAFLAVRAKIITEIELFYLYPNQRRWKTWFPDIICYSVPIKDIQKRIKEIDRNKNNSEDPSFISEKLRRLADVPKPGKMDNKLEDKLEEIEKRIKQVEESTDKLEEIEKKIKQIEESTDKHFQLLMEKLNKIKLL
ncbi:10923_t:CDS:2 [Entrophospora sp. SA101]|nr:10923_t:CDS:2 [Entrophospora sp. SA101]